MVTELNCASSSNIQDGLVKIYLMNKSRLKAIGDEMRDIIINVHMSITPHKKDLTFTLLLELLSDWYMVFYLVFW